MHIKNKIILFTLLTCILHASWMQSGIEKKSGMISFLVQPKKYHFSYIFFKKYKQQKFYGKTNCFQTSYPVISLEAAVGIVCTHASSVNLGLSSPDTVINVGEKDVQSQSGSWYKRCADNPYCHGKHEK